MSPELVAKLYEDFPGLFANHTKPFYRGIGCGDGWYNIIRVFCYMASKEATNENTQTSVFCIKEKFGGMRIQLNNGTSRIYELANFAENISVVTCETCGSPGSIKGDVWLKCTCSNCEQKQPDG